MKKLLAPAFALLLALCLAVPAAAQVTVEGRLLGHDGQPMAQAHVRVAPPDRPADLTAFAETGPDGRFTLRIDTTGAFHVTLLGVHHAPVVRPLFVEEPGVVRLRARLAPYRLAGSLDAVQAVGDFGAGSAPRPMRRQPGGTFAATVGAPRDSVAYRLLGAVRPRDGASAIAGTQADAFRYDGRRAYRAVLAAPRDSVRLVFDPAQLPQAEEREPQITVENAEASAPARTAALLFRTSALNARLAHEINRVQEDFARQLRRGAMDDPQAALHRARLRIDSIRQAFDASDAAASLTERLASADAPAERRALLAAYFSLPDVGQEKDPALAAQALKAIPPESGLWALQRGTLNQLLSAASEAPDARAYGDAVIRLNPHASIRGQVLFARLQQAQEAADVESAQAIYEQLLTRADGTASAADARLLARSMGLRDAPARPRRIQTGRPVPNFELTAFDDSTTTYSRRGLRGQTYLIDFWAVWCGPCVQEMPNLRAVYDAYKDRGFSILSVSLDDRPADVRAFREERHAMPWKHAFLGEDVRGPITRRFEVFSIPKPILVGPEGRIRATGNALRGPSLQRTLDRVLGEGAAPSE